MKMKSFFRKRFGSRNTNETNTKSHDIPLDCAHYRRRVSPLAAITKQYTSKNIEMKQKYDDSSDSDNESIASACMTFRHDELLSECVHLKRLQPLESGMHRSSSERSLDSLGSVSSRHSRIGLNQSNSSLTSSSVPKVDRSGSNLEYISYIDAKISQRRNSTRTESTSDSRDTNDRGLLGSFSDEIDTATDDYTLVQPPRKIKVTKTPVHHSFDDLFDSTHSTSLPSSNRKLSTSFQKSLVIDSSVKKQSPTTRKIRRQSKRSPKESEKIDNDSSAVF